MGRKKITIAKLEAYGDRKITYGKRCMGLMKKAYEISVLCDVSVALIMLPPTNNETGNGRKISFFASHCRIEDCWIEYLQAHEDVNNKLDPEARIVIPDKESLIQLLENIKIQDYQHNPAPREPRNQEGTSNPIVTSEHGMQSSLDLQQEEMKKQLYKTNNRLEFFQIALRLYHLYQDTPTKDPGLWEFCQIRLNQILSEVHQEKQNLVAQERQTRLYNAWIWQKMTQQQLQQQQQQQLQPQQTPVHRDQTSVEAFHTHAQRKMAAAVMEGNQSFTHMSQTQMASQYLNDNRQMPFSTHQAPAQASFQFTQHTHQDQPSSFTENNFNYNEYSNNAFVEENNQGPIQPLAGKASTGQMFSASTDYNPAYHNAEPISYTHQISFGGYGADMNYCNFIQYPEYKNANNQGL